ncbi:hypothetical protein CFN16_26960 [Pseudomonas fluorescens]|uniref:Uncharacterized protein n=1 Tax=Pseudomonas fluorescens TaxID=294 RepID=A0A345V4J0_PSEFL|nr:hypothetical protein CFN16_26960 [Pseudomonas fluorescens]
MGVLAIGIPCVKRSRRRASGGTLQVSANIAGRRTALFGARASLSVDRGDGRHSTCLRYPCARLTQESSAI